MQSQLRQLKTVNIADKRVVVRVDWNVTIGKALQIVDDTRIVRTLPTIKWLLANGARQVVLLSHLGKSEEKRSLEPIARYAERLLREKIALKRTITQARDDVESRIIMLENVRSWEGEDTNEPTFAKELVSLGEIYVNEAFGECHRESASIVGIPLWLPSYAGLWLVEEVEAILKVRDNPARPLVVVMGGAKVEDKLPLLQRLMEMADAILVGGKLANEILRNSIKLIGKARVIMPVEPAFARASAGEGEYFDIGVETRKIFAEEIAKAQTVVWNGPMGRIENPQYRAGTEAIYTAMVANESAFTLVGGGDTLAAIGKAEHLYRIDHVSTGGGAMLTLLEKGTLPGIKVLESRA